MKAKILALIVGGALAGGCYHVTVETGAAPSPIVVDKPWQLSFIYGLVPPPELNVKAECPNGVSKVETETSFLNGLVGGLTYSLFTPVHARVTCAAKK